MNGAPPKSFAKLYPEPPADAVQRGRARIREYERTSTACANAYVQPLMRRYLSRLETRLTEIGFSGRLHVMLSAAGSRGAGSQGLSHPHDRIRSGGRAHGGFVPGASCRGSTASSRSTWAARRRRCAWSRTVRPITSSISRPDACAASSRGSASPLKVSVVDMIEIGAGGGSIARVEPSSGLMKVGPRSAARSRARCATVLAHRADRDRCRSSARAAQPDYFSAARCSSTWPACAARSGRRRARAENPRNGFKHSASSASSMRRWRRRPACIWPRRAAIRAATH